MEMMRRMVLTADERECVEELLDELVERHDSVEDGGFLNQASLYAHRLPARLTSFVNEFRYEPVETVCVIAGLPVDDDRIGDTPKHWTEAHAQRPRPTLREEMVLVMLAEILGQCIGWATQQAGRIVHDIAPVKGHEGEQLGSGSEQLLWWHVEDAFHPFRGDYLGMMCLRNPDGVPTTVGGLNGSRLDEETVRLLFEPQFHIRPDESHLPKNRGIEGSDDQMDEAYERMQTMNMMPERIGVLSGSPDNPYLRLDPYFMDEASTPEAQKAFEALVDTIEESMQDMVLSPGEICFIDNFRAVHGRKPFKARYDGRDRWLKRVNVARDLRKSRMARAHPGSRVIY